MLRRQRHEGLVSALDNALGANVNPGTGGHLTVHHQSLSLELAEMLPIGPFADQVRVGNQDPGRIRSRAEDTNRLTGLDQESFVVLQLPQGPDDRVETVPIARRFAGSAVDDQFVGILRDLGVEVVHQHA